MGKQLSLLSDNAEPGERKVLSVSELTKRIKHTLETGFSTVMVEGEVSNAKFHSSGHIYFALKDSSATVSAVCWRSRVQHLSFVPEDGMKVVATGRISVYEIRGNYQLDVTSLRPVGIGELQIAFEKLKRKLTAEGLFDEEHKKPLPEYPERIGIVTAETGAALQDVLHILRRRFPDVEVILSPTPVQGPGSAQAIASAIADLNKFALVDVIIVCRGGGSMQDLWSFNEEVVARAIFASTIPIISAVGHEVDFTIADFVADYRAPTPSAAAEMVVRDRFALLDILRDYWYHMNESATSLVNNRRNIVQNLLKSYSFNKPIGLLRQHSQRVDELERTMNAGMTHKFTLLKVRIESLKSQLMALDPNQVLRRGYAIVRKQGHVVSSHKALKGDDIIEITLRDGSVDSKVIDNVIIQKREQTVV